MTITEKPIAEPVPTGRLIRVLLLSSALVVLLFCIFTVLDFVGFFEKWEIVAVVPENLDRITYASSDTATIRTTNKQVLTCWFGDENNCWFPDVLDVEADSFAEDCDKRHIAFMLFRNAPRDRKYCVYFDSVMIETNSKMFFVVDHQNRLWKWEKSIHANMVILILMLIAPVGLVGLCIGSLIAFIQYRKRKYYSGAILFTLTHLQRGLLTIPWLGLLVLALYVYLNIVSPSYKFAAPPNPLYTQVAATVNAQLTAEAARLSTATSPDASGANTYYFAEHACDAEWSYSWTEYLDCNSIDPGALTPVRTLYITTYNEQIIEDRAIYVASKGKQQVSGTFPPVTIHPGDHFKTYIGCVDENKPCNIIFNVSMHSDMNGFINLGRWNAQQTGQIDIDVEIRW